jgi:hypothetical protein
MENEIVPVREIVQVEVKRREPRQDSRTATEVRMRMEEFSYHANVVLSNIFEAMAKPKR